MRVDESWRSSDSWDWSHPLTYSFDQAFKVPMQPVLFLFFKINLQALAVCFQNETWLSRTDFMAVWNTNICQVRRELFFAAIHVLWRHKYDHISTWRVARVAHRSHAEVNTMLLTVLTKSVVQIVNILMEEKRMKYKKEVGAICSKTSTSLYTFALIGSLLGAFPRNI